MQPNNVTSQAKKVQKHEKQPEEWENLDLEVKEVEIKDQTKITKEEVKRLKNAKKKQNRILAGYEGDLLTLSVILKEEAAAFTDDDVEKIKSQGKSCILSWCEEHQAIVRRRTREACENRSIVAQFKAHD